MIPEKFISSTGDKDIYNRRIQINDNFTVYNDITALKQSD